MSVATALDYFKLIFKPEICSEIRDHTNNCAIFKQDEIQRNWNNPDFVDSGVLGDHTWRIKISLVC